MWLDELIASARTTAPEGTLVGSQKFCENVIFVPQKKKILIEKIDNNFY